MKYNGPKARLCRKQGMNLFGSDKYDRILQKKPYGPGKGPRTRQGKASEYSQQLSEKQKLRYMFGIAERQFRRYFKEAQRRKTATGAYMLQLLETRLDNSVFRAGFAITRPQARQMCGHGLFFLNGRRIDCPSLQVKPGDVVEVRPASSSSPLFTTNLEATEKHMPPTWMRVDPSKLRIEVVSIPTPEDCEKGIDIQKVVELYSR